MMNILLLFKNIIIHPVVTSKAENMFNKTELYFWYFAFFGCYIISAFYKASLVTPMYIIMALILTFLGGFLQIIIVSFIFTFVINFRDSNKYSIRNIINIILPYLVLQTIFFLVAYIFTKGVTLITFNLLINVWIGINIYLIALNRCKKNQRVSLIVSIALFIYLNVI